MYGYCAAHAYNFPAYSRVDTLGESTSPDSGLVASIASQSIQCFRTCTAAGNAGYAERAANSTDRVSAVPAWYFNLFNNRCDEYNWRSVGSSRQAVSV